MRFYETAIGSPSLFIYSNFSPAQSKEDVLNRYAKAVGGREHWKSLTTMRIIKRGYVMENNPAYKKLKGDSTLSIPDLLAMNGAISVSTDTVYISKPDKMVSVISLTKLGKQKSEVNPLITYEYYDGNRIKRETMSYVDISTDKNRLINQQKRCDNYFISQNLFNSEASLSWLGEKEFNKKIYYTLSGNIEKLPTNINTTYWYLFDKASGLLEVIKPVNVDGDPYTLIQNYKNFEGLVLDIRQDSIINGEPMISIEYLDFKRNIDIPAHLTDKL